MSPLGHPENPCILQDFFLGIIKAFFFYLLVFILNIKLKYFYCIILDSKSVGIIFVSYREHMHSNSKNLLLTCLGFFCLLMILMFVCILQNVFVLCN